MVRLEICLGWCLLVTLVAAACAPVPRGAAPAVDVTGLWEGEWLIAGVGKGSLAMTLTQRGPWVTGELALTGSRGLQGGSVAGRVSGATLLFQSDGGLQAEATVEGDRMTGRARATQIAQIVLRRRPMTLGPWR